MGGARGRRPLGSLAGSWKKVANHILPKKNQHLLPCCYNDDVPLRKSDFPLSSAIRPLHLVIQLIRIIGEPRGSNRYENSDG